MIDLGLRHRLLCRADRANTGSSASRACRSRSTSPPSSAIARRRCEPRRPGAVRLAVGRDGRHARRAALRQGAGPAHPLDRQRADLDDRARERRASRRRWPGPRSASPRPRPSPASSPCLPASRSRPDARAARCRESDEARLVERADRSRRGLMAEALKREAQIEVLARDLAKARDVLYLGRGTSYPAGAGRRAEAQGNLLHPRRGLCGGRAQARPDRADRRGHAGHRHRAA